MARGGLKFHKRNSGKAGDHHPTWWSDGRLLAAFLLQSGFGRIDLLAF